MRWVTVGGGGRNVGITQFAVRKRSYGVYDYEAFVSVTNFSDEAMTFPLVVTMDDRVVSEQPIHLPPQVKRNVIVPFTHQGGGRVRIEARAEGDLAADKVVYGVIPSPRRLRVLLVSPGNLFLEKALRTAPQVVLETTLPA